MCFTITRNLFLYVYHQFHYDDRHLIHNFPFGLAIILQKKITHWNIPFLKNSHQQMHILFQPYMHHIHGKKNVQTCHFRVLCLVIVDIIGWEGLRIHVRKLQHYKLTLIKSRKQPGGLSPMWRYCQSTSRVHVSRNCQQKSISTNYIELSCHRILQTSNKMNQQMS